ncbi:protein of unknown function [Xenorhabdus doucetiae]|uniref:Uncharacterized protein n=1 Tax=Xenorhabdus doucetiae TaxID=351671 RepID=A0A068QS49_9GAMM|nr:protein of unknown function [Xenorhabdus doucetiae]
MGLSHESKYNSLMHSNTSTLLSPPIVIQQFPPYRHAYLELTPDPGSFTACQ